MVYVDVSENSGTPKLSHFNEFSIINHPCWGSPIFGNTHVIVPQQGIPFHSEKFLPDWTHLSGHPKKPEAEAQDVVLYRGVEEYWLLEAPQQTPNQQPPKKLGPQPAQGYLFCFRKRYPGG